MKQQEVFKKIGIIIKELNEQYNYLEGTTGQLNDLELELFVANAHFLAEHSEVLRKLNLQNTPKPAETPKPIIDNKEKFFEPVVQQAPPLDEIKPEISKITTPLPAEIPSKPIETKADIGNTEDKPVPHIEIGSSGGADDDFSYIRPQEPETIRHELILDETENWDDEDDEGFISEELTEEEIIDTPPVKATKAEAPKPIIEKHEAKAKIEDTREEPLTINQKMSAQLQGAGSRATEHMHTQTISDLKQAITLNDKLLYIKDLFNGYSLAYSEAIEILNRLSTFEEAEKFLQSSYAVKNEWGSKQTTADKFYDLLKRRYL